MSATAFQNVYPTGPDTCTGPDCQVAIGSYANAFYVINLTFFGGVLALCTSFLTWRAARLRRSPVPWVTDTDKSASVSASSKVTTPRWRVSETDEHRVEVPGEHCLKFRGFRAHWLGSLCYALCCAVSLQFQALFIVILVDYYMGCQVRSIDNLCFYGNHFLFGSYDANGLAFFVIWCASVVWYTGWVLCKGRVINWFRVPVADLRAARWVGVWAPDHAEVLTQYASPLVLWFRKVKRALTPSRARGQLRTVPIEGGAGKKEPTPSSPKAAAATATPTPTPRFFTFQGLRFLIEPERGLPMRARWKVASSTADIHALSPGLSTAEAAARRAVVGPNACPFRPSTFSELLVDEFFTLFHVYQLVQYVLWFWNSYLFVAAIMTLVVLLAAAFSMLLVARAQRAIAQVANTSMAVEAKRDGAWVTLDSTDLVPGDVVRVRPDSVVPCDLAVMSGTCVVDESALTGESMPTLKSACAREGVFYDCTHPLPRYTLFAGTSVRQATAGGNGNGTVKGGSAAAAVLSKADVGGGANGCAAGDEATVEAAVISTGMDTSKGDLLAVILFPSAMVFKYDEEMPVVITLLLLYSVACFILSIDFQNRSGVSSTWVTKWIYCTSVVNQILSPLLPVALEVGQIQAMKRLKAKGIVSLQPKRIMISGKVRVYAFDKTGTLTKDGLDFLGFRPVVPPPAGSTAPARLGKLALPNTGLDQAHMLGLATCHSAETCGDMVIANEVEYKMFEATGWTFASGDGEVPVVLRSPSGGEYTLLQRYDFDHTRMTQSVVVRAPDGAQEIFVKGSFEKIGALCRPGSLTAEHGAIARSHAMNGCYVLALASRSLGMAGAEDAPDAWKPLKRADIESDLTFKGLIIFRNELRPDSAETIAALKSGDVRPVMITGDSPQCGVYIARELGMVNPSASVLLGDFDPATATVHWRRVAPTGASVHGGASPAPAFDDDEPGLPTNGMLDAYGPDLESGACELAVTGSAFKMLRQAGLIPRLLYFIRVFGRVKPEGKIMIIDAFVASGVVVGMCGDGGNDCGALRTAHTGVALSKADASMVSPFTAKTKTVSSVVDLLREGRGALHTSIAAYKFLIMYGLLFSVLKLSFYYYGVIMCQMAYFMTEGIAIIALPYTMTLSLPAAILGKHRPSHGLLSPKTTSSVLGLWAMNTAFSIGALFYMQASPDYVRWPAQNAVGAAWWTLGDNWESTVLFFMTFSQFITSGLVFSLGASFNRPLIRNYLLCAVWGGLYALTLFLLLSPPNTATRIFHVASQNFNGIGTDSPVWMKYQSSPADGGSGGKPSSGMSFGFRLGLMALMLANGTCNALWQVALLGPLGNAFRRLRPSKRPRFRL